MVEVHTGGWEAQQKSSINAAETARGNRQAEQEQQIHQPVMPPSSQEEREQRHTATQQQRSRDEFSQIGEQPTDRQAQKEASWTPRDDEFINEIFGGETEEEINARNERIKEDQEKEQLKKEKLREETLKQYEEYHARIAAMTPEEREAWDRRVEKCRTALELLTDEDWSQLVARMNANCQAMRRKKAAWMHERDPRYDPMTGDLLESDEHPLDPKAEYTFDGKTRARSFVHPEARSFLSPDDPLLKYRKPVQAHGNEEEPESESNQRLVERLLKAGFVEVEPTLADKASFEHTQFYRSLSPTEKMHFLQESMREMTRGRSIDKKPADEKFARFIELLIDFMIALIDSEIMEKKKSDQAA